MHILFTDDEEEKNDLDNSRLKPPNPFSQSMNGDKVIILKIFLLFWITQPWVHYPKENDIFCVTTHKAHQF